MNLSKRNLLIFGSIAGILLIIISVLIFAVHTKPVTAPDEQGYLDPGSGETIKTDKDPQGNTANSIIFPGFSQLIDRGLSPDQVQSLQSMLTAYSVEKNKKFKEVSLQVDSIRHLLPKGTSRTQTLTFDLVINRTDNYYMTAAYEDTTTVQSKLFAADKTTLLYSR